MTGPGAEAWLDGLVANKVPTKIGRIALCHALTKKGGIRTEFTITKMADEHFYVVSAGAAERYDSDYLQKMLHLAPAGSVSLRNITTSRGCFVVAGPRSREVLATLTDTPLDNAAFPWLSGQVAEVGLATDVYLMRVNFVGALGWELHFPIEYAHHLFDAIFAAGEPFGIRMAGMRARKRSRNSWPRASRTASSRSRCMASRMRIRSAMSRSTMPRVASLAGRQVAIMAIT